MATLTIGGKSVTVDDSFRNLSPADQQKAVDEISQAIGLDKAPAAQQYPTDAAGNIQTINPMMQGQSAPSAPGPDLGEMSNQLSAGFTSGVNAIPIAGPSILGGLERAKSFVQGRPYSDVTASDKLQATQRPVASGIGSVAGTVLPFLAAAPESAAGTLLGMSGGLGARMAFGGMSGAAINGADTFARGGSPQDVLTSAATGAGFGTAIPVLGRFVGDTTKAIFGNSVPQDTVNVARALQADKIPVPDINRRLSDLGPDAKLMDLGPNLQRQAGALASIPGPAQSTVRDVVAARGVGASNRVSADVAGTIGTGPDLDTLKEQIIAQQKASASPLYEAVRDKTVPLTGNLKFIAQTPFGKRAFAEAVTTAKNDGYGYQTNTVGLMDYAKQSLDDMASTFARQGQNNKARQAANMARLLRTEVDKVAPGYALARDAFAGPAKVLDAIDAGTTVFTKDMTPTQLQSALTAATPSERDAYLQGARHYIETQMGNAVNDPLALRNMFKKSYNEQKLRTLLGNSIADDLLKRIGREATFSQTSHVVSGNSETAARQAAQAEVAPELRAVPKLSATWTGMVLSAFDKARNAIHGINQTKINDRMGSILTSGQITPDQIAALARAAPKRRPELLAPAAAGLLPKQILSIPVPYDNGN